MENDQIFTLLPYLQEKHSRKRGMPKPAAKPKPVPAMHTADLTQAIIKYIRSRGGYAVRVNCAGIFDQKANRWRKSATARGTADIHACIDGKHVSIEIKIGDDRQSDAQKQCEKQVREAGGIYLLVGEFGEFHAWYLGRNNY